MVPQCFGPRQKKISYEYCGYDESAFLVALLFGLYLIYFLQLFVCVLGDF